MAVRKETTLIRTTSETLGKRKTKTNKYILGDEQPHITRGKKLEERIRGTEWKNDMASNIKI
jgi:hypothetical protein